MRLSRVAIFAAFAIVLCAPAQELIDATHLEKVRRDFEQASPSTLRCGIKAIQPTLNFGLRLQAGYKLDVPLNQFEGTGHGWVGLIRVTPSGGHAVYLASDGKLPDIPDKNKADGEFVGSFVVGEGAYDVGVLVKDDQGRTCRNNWHINAKLAGAERTLAASMPANTVAAVSAPHYFPQPASAKIARVTILLHAVPRRSRAYTINENDAAMLLNMLATLLEQLPAREIRLVAFNLEQQQELLRVDRFTAKDVSRVSDALNQVQLGKVDVSVLQNRTGSADMLTDLVHKELHREHPSDAVVFVGAHSRMHDPIAEFEQLTSGAPQFFYLEYARLQIRGRTPMGWRGGPRMPTAESRGPADAGGFDMNIQYLRTPDSIEQLITRIKGHTLTLANPRELAAAIVRVRQSTEAR